jgi:hypothetical protein
MSYLQPGPLTPCLSAAVVHMFKTTTKKKEYRKKKFRSKKKVSNEKKRRNAKPKLTRARR